MITTLLLQTMMATSSGNSAQTARPETSALGNMVPSSVVSAAKASGEQALKTTEAALTGTSALGNMVPSSVVSGEQLQRILDAAEAAKASGEQALKTTEAALKSQEWGKILFGSTPRILWTSLNAATLLAAGAMTTYLQFVPHDSTNTPLGGNTTTAAPSYYDKARGFYDSLSPSDQQVTQASAALWIFGIGDSLIQYCVTKGTDLKEALQSDLFAVGDEMAEGGGSEPTATDWFKDVANVVVGEEGPSRQMLTLTEFQQRGYNTENPYAAEAFFVILKNGDKVQINDVGQRMDQVLSATAATQ